MTVEKDGVTMEEDGGKEWRKRESKEAKERLSELATMFEEMKTIEFILNGSPPKRASIRSDPELSELVIEDIEADPHTQVDTSSKEVVEDGAGNRLVQSQGQAHKRESDVSVQDTASHDHHDGHKPLGNELEDGNARTQSTRAQELDRGNTTLEALRTNTPDALKEVQGSTSKRFGSAAAKYDKQLAVQRSLQNGLSKSKSLSMEWQMVEPDNIDETVPKSFYFFARANPFRNRIARVLFWLTGVANNVVIALAPETIDAGMLQEWDAAGVLPKANSAAVKAKFANAWLQTFSWGGLFDVICVFVLFTEILIGMIALGVWASRRKYLSWLSCSPHHSIDLFVLLFSIVEYALMLLGLKSITMRGLRLLRIVSLVARVPWFGGVATIAETLYKGSAQLLTVLVVLVFFIAALSIFGMAIFQDAFRRYCAVDMVNVPFTACASSDFSRTSNCASLGSASQAAVLEGYPPVVGGGYPFRRACKTYLNTSTELDSVFAFSRSQEYHTCVQYGEKARSRSAGYSRQTCVIGDNVGTNSFAPYGFAHFDHIGGAMLAMWQYALTDSAYDVLHTSLASEPGAVEIVTMIYFITTSVLCTFLCLGLFVVVVTGTFHRVREERESSVQYEIGDIKDRNRDDSRRVSAHAQKSYIRRFSNLGHDDAIETSLIRKTHGQALVKAKHIVKFAEAFQNSRSILQTGYSSPLTNAVGRVIYARKQSDAQLLPSASPKDDKTGLGDVREGASRMDASSRPSDGTHGHLSGGEAGGGPDITSVIAWGGKFGLPTAARGSSRGDLRTGADGVEMGARVGDETPQHMSNHAAHEKSTRDVDVRQRNANSKAPDATTRDAEAAYADGSDAKLGVSSNSHEHAVQIQTPDDTEAGTRTEGDAEVDEDVALRESRSCLGRVRHVLATLLCTMALSRDSYSSGAWSNPSDAWQIYVFVSYIVCNSFFGLELLLKLFALGPRKFWDHRTNRAGLFVSSCALAGLLGHIRILIFIPTVRLYRIMRYVPTLQGLVLSSITSSGAILSLCTFILVMAICFSVTARYVIATDMDGITRSNFGTFGSSLLTIFQLFTGDSWSSVLYSAMFAKSSLQGQVCCAALIIGWICFSKAICQNLFIAVIIENFHVSEAVASIRTAGMLRAVRRSFAGAWGRLHRNRVADSLGMLAVDPVDSELVVRLATSSVLSTGPSPSESKKASQPAGAASLDKVTDPGGAAGLHQRAEGARQAADTTGIASAEGSQAFLRRRASKLISSSEMDLLRNISPSPKHMQDGTQGVAPSEHAVLIHGTSQCATTTTQSGSEPFFSAPQKSGNFGEISSSMTISGAKFGEGGGSGKGDHHDSNDVVSFVQELQDDEWDGPVDQAPGQPVGQMSAADARTAAAVVGELATDNHEAAAAEKVTMSDIPKLFKSDSVKLLTQQSGIRLLAKKRNKPERVLFLFEPDDPIRCVFVYIGTHPVFELLVYAAIIASMVILALTPAYNDIPGNSPLIGDDVSALCDVIFTIVFTLELVCRVMAHGLIQTQRGYFRSTWNCVDFVVLIFAYVDLFAVFDKGQFARAVRLFRALRPLRLMKRNIGMRLIIDALISTLPPIVYIIVFGCFNFLVFAIIGVGILGGRLSSCSLPGAEYPMGLAECSGTQARLSDGVLRQRVWSSPDWNFDTIGSSIMVLFRINTLKYVSVLNSVMDVTELDKSPVQYRTWYNAFFIVGYIIVGPLFIMNLFVGFIVDGFQMNKGDSKVDARYTRLQLHLGRFDRSHRRPNPKNKVSFASRRIVESRGFQLWMVLCVMANVGIMMSDHANASPAFQTFMKIQNLVFLIELVAEVFLYLIAYGPIGYVHDQWCMVDLVAAVGTSVGYISYGKNLVQFAKAFRLLRVMRLMRMFTPVRIILETLISCLPQLVNIIILLFLVYSMFAVVFVQLFATTKYGVRLGPTANFETFLGAMLTCYQFVTGDEWQDVMIDCSVVPPACTEQFSGYSFGDCGSPYSFGVFATFKIVCESVMLNLFIGMILDNFSFITDEVGHVPDAEWSDGPSLMQIGQLAVHFERFDAGTGRIPLSALRSFTNSIPKPLGQRTARGALAYGTLDRVVEKLVRAELVLYVQENQKTSFWTKHLLSFASKLKLNVPKTTSMRTSVPFDEMILTLVHWKLPKMVPNLVKFAREDRVQETITMVHVLVIKDFLQNLVAKRKQQKLVHAQNFWYHQLLHEKNGEPSQWCDVPEHMVRYCENRYKSQNEYGTVLRE